MNSPATNTWEPSGVVSSPWTVPLGRGAKEVIAAPFARLTAPARLMLCPASVENVPPT
ncbi:MAG: hypothetical protein IPF42_14575 [Candidatus Microthrix sp.]|nr:hypothetical protein [Candidatus Microthrix sp.]